MALALLISGKISLALNIAVFALVVLYFLHSLAFLLLPRLNPELFRSVTVRIPLSVQRIAAVLSMAAMAVLIVQLARDRATMVLAGFWTLIGAVLYVVECGDR